MVRPATRSAVERALSALASAALLALAACQTSVDSLGSNAPLDAGPELDPLRRPASYPNAFRDLLGKTEAEISAKLASAFEQLFHGDPNTEAIYFPVGADQAYIRDIFHGDIRSEGIGLGMLISVELDEREEFDRLWAYAKTVLAYQTGPNRGYFRSFCDTPAGAVPCVDPYGPQQFATALLFAHGRWGSASGAHDYGADVLELLRLMRGKEAENGGVIEGVTDIFDDQTKLVFDVPNVAAASFTRPSLVMPGYYALWAQATGDAFWTGAAESARRYLPLVAHPTTGLTPRRAYFDGTPLPGSSMFDAECYRVQLNLVLDRIWTGGDAWQVEESNRLLEFFASQGLETYGLSYTLEGVPIDPSRDFSLLAMNGVSALIATHAERRAFVEAVWNLPTPVGLTRYYAGLLHLLALLVLSGRLQVY